MKVWIDQDLCTGDGLCEEIAPDVFVGLDDGLFYVKEGEKIFSEEHGNVGGAEGCDDRASVSVVICELNCQLEGPVDNVVNHFHQYDQPAS